jgi:hypothetical protein
MFFLAQKIGAGLETGTKIMLEFFVEINEGRKSLYNAGAGIKELAEGWTKIAVSSVEDECCIAGCSSGRLSSFFPF